MRKALPILLVFAVAAFLLLMHLGAPPLDEAEARSAIVSRHILATGQWLWPAPPKPFVCQKSPLPYWAPLPHAALGGMTEWAVRLPAALCALALMLLTWDLTRRWFDGRTALLAAGVLATSVGFISWGRHGSAEMAQAALILCLLWLLAKHQGDTRGRWLWGLGLLAGLAAHFGALEAYTVLAASVLVLALWAKGHCELPPWKAWAAPAALSLAVFLAIPVAGSLATGSGEPLWAVWREHVAQYFQPIGAAYPWHRDVQSLIRLCAPWFPFLLIALWHDLRRRRDGARVVEVIFLAEMVMVCLVLPSSREPRHLLPVVPLASIIVGHLLARFSAGTLARWARLAVMAVALLLGAIPLAVVALTLWSSRGGGQLSALRGAWVPLGLLALGGLAAVASALRRSGPGLVAAAAAVLGAWVVGVVPRDAAQSDVRDAAARLRGLARPVAFLGEANAQAAFYLGGEYATVPYASAARQWAQDAGGVVVTAQKLSDPCWQSVVDGRSWQALVWNPQAKAVSLTRDPAWLAAHPLRGIKSETLTYVFSAEALARFNLGTVTMRLSRQDTTAGRELVITAESKGGVPGYPMASTITSRLRDSDLSQLEADDAYSKPSYKHRRFVWNAEGLDYSLHAHCRDKACRDPRHMITRRDGTNAHCMDKRCGNLDHYVWRLKQQFRGPQAQNAWHVVAACYVARGFDLKPGAPPQTICVVNNEAMWELAIRAVEEKAIEVPAGKFDCYKLGFDAKPLNEAARESAGEAEGPFGLTGHVDLYVDKTTKLLILLDGQIELGVTFKVQIQLSSRKAEAQ